MTDDSQNHPGFAKLHQAFNTHQEIKLLPISTITELPPAHINNYSRHIKRRNAISIPPRSSSLVEQYNDYFLKKAIETKNQQQEQQQQKKDHKTTEILLRMRQLMLSAINELECLSNQLFDVKKKAQYWQLKCTELQNQLDELHLLHQNTVIKLEKIQSKLIESEHVRLHWHKIPVISYQYPSNNNNNNNNKSSLKKKISLSTNISRIFHLS